MHLVCAKHKECLSIKVGHVGHWVDQTVWYHMPTEWSRDPSNRYMPCVRTWMKYLWVWVIKKHWCSILLCLSVCMDVHCSPARPQAFLTGCKIVIKSVMNQLRKVSMFRLHSVVHKRQSRQLAANVTIAHFFYFCTVMPLSNLVVWPGMLSPNCLVLSNDLAGFKTQDTTKA